MRIKTLLLLLVAVGCGLGAAVMTQKLLNERNPPITLIRAKRDIAKWTAIKDDKWVTDNFDVQRIARDEVAPEVLAKSPVQDLHWLLSRTKDHVIAQKLSAGDPLMSEYVVEKTGIGIGLQRGFTAFTIRATGDTAGIVSANDWVKVLSVRKTPSGDKISKVLMQYVRVAAVDSVADRAQRDEKVAARAPATVTLEVTDEESKELKKAQEDGPLSLSVISYRDLELVDLDDRYKADKRKGEPEDRTKARPRLNTLIRVGYAALAIKTSAHNIAGGGIIPGDRVKVIGFRMVRTAAGEKKRPFLLMKNIRVVAVDDVTQKTEDLAGVVAKTVSLEVTEPEAKKIIESQDVGEIHLALMSEADLRDASEKSGRTAKTEAQLDSDREGDKLPDFDEDEKGGTKDKKDDAKEPKTKLITTIIAGPGTMILEQEVSGRTPVKPNK
jgi:Flp pilus assembly protein CpaB